MKKKKREQEKRKIVQFFGDIIPYLHNEFFFNQMKRFMRPKREKERAREMKEKIGWLSLTER